MYETCFGGSLLGSLWEQVVGAVGLVLLLATGELAPTNVLGFCVAARNAFGLIAGESPALSMPLGPLEPLLPSPLICEHYS